MKRPLAALCHSNRITKEKGSTHKALTEVQGCFTTQGTQSTNKSDDEALDRGHKLTGCSSRSIFHTLKGNIAQLITAFHRSLICFLRAPRGAFFSTFGLASQQASVLCEVKSEGTARAKRQGSKKLVLALLFLVILCVSVFAQPRLQVMLDFFPNPNHVPLIVAARQGFFSDEGIDVDLVVPGNPSDPIKLVAAGAVDIALTPQINLLIARNAGLPVIAIGSLIGSPLGGLLALKGDGISRLSDLRGRRIGYSLAPLEPILWRTMLASVGVKPGEYELINVGFNTVLSLLSGKVDAIGAFRNFEVPQVSIAGQEPIFFPEEKYGVPHTEEIIIAANANTVSKDAVKMRAFLAGLARGITFTKAHPQEAFQEFVAAYPDLDDALNRRAYEITLPLFSNAARLGPAQEWQNLQGYLFKNKLINSEFKLAALYTEAYLPGKKE